MTPSGVPDTAIASDYYDALAGVVGSGGPRTIPFQLKAGGYPGNELVLPGGFPLPSAICMTSDGLNLYIHNDLSNLLVRYSMSTAWDLSTAVDAGQTYDYDSGISGDAQDLTISPDGTKLFVLGDNNVVYDHTFSTPNDPSTGSFTGSTFNSTVLSSGMKGLHVNSAGDRIYIASVDSPAVYQLTLGTPWSLGGAIINDSNVDLSTQLTAGPITRITPFVNDDAYELIVMAEGVDIDGEQDGAYKYTFNTQDETDSARYSQQYLNTWTRIPVLGKPAGMAMRPDGRSIFICQPGDGGGVFEYTTSVKAPGI